MISYLQSNFIPGRGTTDNVIVTQEIVHYMQKSKDKKGSTILKIDIEKAYDNVDWNFLEETLRDFSFLGRIIYLMMYCVTFSSLVLIWHGNHI